MEMTDESTELSIIAVIGADKWKRIEGSITDLLRDALPFPRYGRKKTRRDLIRNVFHEIWETRDLQGEYSDLDEDDHAVLLETVHFEVERQVMAYDKNLFSVD
jgi:hypothetical protein